MILSSSGGHAIVEPTSSATDVNGEAIFQVTDNSPEQVTVTATDTFNLSTTATTPVSWIANAPNGPFFLRAGR